MSGRQFNHNSSSGNLLETDDNEYLGEFEQTSGDYGGQFQQTLPATVNRDILNQQMQAQQQH